MLVTFRSKYYSDITYLGDIAIDLLKAMGQSGKVPGAIAPEDVSSALRALRGTLADIAADDSEDGDANKRQEGGDSDNEPVVTMNQRAVPLIELLESAIKEKQHVTWES